MKPTGVPTLGPNQYAVLADQVVGSTRDGEPSDAIGNVNVFFSEGVLVGDRAHYDGHRFIDVTGHAYLKQNADDSILRSEVVRFDTTTQQAFLVDSRGETTHGVETGKLYFTAQSLTSQRNGVAHGTNATVTTCDNPHGGYHIFAKTLDITPGDRAVLRKAVLFLGPLAIFYLPLVVIPLDRGVPNRPNTSGFIPVLGYSQAEGFYVKAKIGFGPSDTYYGYYRVDAFSKLGIGLGYVAFFRRHDNKRAVDVDFYRFKNKQDGSNQNNFNLNDSENFSNRMQGQFALRYLGNYGPLITLPPSYTINGNVRYTATHSTENYTFARSSTGGQQSSVNLGFVDQRQLSDKLTQGFNVSFTNNQSNYAGSMLQNSTLHFNTLTHYSGRAVDYDLAFDKTESQQPSGIERVPELSIRPHALFPNFRLVPIQSSLVVGQYTEPQSQLTASRGELLLNLGPSLARVLNSDFSASVSVRQDAYATGDLKAQIQQTASLSSPFGRHIINAITYNEQNSNGPAFEPFKTIDSLSGASHSAQDVFRLFNGDHYALTLSTGTNFNRAAQPIQYQLSTRPSVRSSLALAGSYVPGPGAGFYTTNIQAITPFGRESDLEFTTNINWKARGRLESKNIYYRRIIGECYEILASYNQDLKQFNLGVEILAFPSRSANFGIDRQGPIVPQSFNF